MNTTKCRQSQLPIEKAYEEMDFIEYKNKLIEFAKENANRSASVYLNTGKGNPNWTENDSREAFFSLGKFALEESKRTALTSNLGGTIVRNHLYDRFIRYFDEHPQDKGLHFVMNMLCYGEEVFGFDKDEWLFELTGGIMADNYPQDGHLGSHIEQLIKAYLNAKLGLGSKNELDIFAIEGATMGIGYIFHSLLSNGILKKKDKIAVMTSIYGAHLKMPVFPDMEFEFIQIYDEQHQKNHAALSEESLKKLEDTEIKALFMIYPSNHPMVYFDETTTIRLKTIIEEKNPNLIVISDEVYAPFLEGHVSFSSQCSKNTIGLYSFSKFFGAPGWRLGTISLAKDNVIDKLIERLPKQEKAQIDARYANVSRTPETLTFMERLILDSRLVAMKYTAGLSTPQQVQMALFAMKALMDEQDQYRKDVLNICMRRKKLLFKSLGLREKNVKTQTQYYAFLDLRQWMRDIYGEQLARKIQENYHLEDIIYNLAARTSFILLNEEGVKEDNWIVKVSLAHLPDEQYALMGRSLKKMMDQIVNSLEKSTNCR